MRTPIFENVVNAGLPHRGCVINAVPTWATHIDNALFATLGRVATLPKCDSQSVVNARWLTPGRVDNSLCKQRCHVDAFIHEILM